MFKESEPANQNSGQMILKEWDIFALCSGNVYVWISLYVFCFKRLLSTIMSKNSCYSFQGLHTFYFKEFSWKHSTQKLLDYRF